MPELLQTRVHRIKERHEFLKYLNRAQFDPKKEFYVCPKTVVQASDQEFVSDICDSTMETYINFLKTL